MPENLIPKLFRISEFEESLVKETAQSYGCSQATAVRMLIRRGYDWTPPEERPLRPAPSGWTDAPVDGKLPEIRNPGTAPDPDVPDGQTMIGDEDE